MKNSLVAIAAVLLPSLLVCPEAIASGHLTPSATNSSSCVAPASIPAVDRVLRVEMGQSPAQIEQAMGRSDQGYVRFNRPANLTEMGTMTWTQVRGSRKVEVRVSFASGQATSRSVAMIQHQGSPNEIFCSWSVN